jgi:ribosomal protein S18 acetylase RimI-like enzyme
MVPNPSVELADLKGVARDGAIPVIKQSFVGIYRWHAKRTLHRIATVRAAMIDGQIAGVSMLEQLAPEVSYVYYIAIGQAYRRKGLGRMLLDDALGRFRKEGSRIVYAAAEEDNEPSLALLRSRGFRLIERKERGYKEGGLGAWGLRSKMMLVHGEVLMGRFL